jgi:hypothetical protein
VLRLSPYISGDHSHMTTVADMARGDVKGYFVMGENPVVGSMNGALERKGLRKLDWLVVRDFSLTETAEFWRKAPEIERGEIRPEEIASEVFSFQPRRIRTRTAPSPTRSSAAGILKLIPLSSGACDIVHTFG